MQLQVRNVSQAERSWPFIFQDSKFGFHLYSLSHKKSCRDLPNQTSCRKSSHYPSFHLFSYFHNLSALFHAVRYDRSRRPCVCIRSGRLGVGAARSSSLPSLPPSLILTYLPCCKHQTKYGCSQLSSRWSAKAFCY